MEAFRIACTTCRARLTVRDAQAIGQILPCPKCGSMVLVESPKSSTTDDPPQLSESDRETAANSSMLSGSFDNLHEFLDEPTQATDHPTTSETEATGPANHTSEEAEATSQRWRNQDSSSELPEESFAEAAATVETAQPVQPSTEKNESNETDQLAETVPSQQANRHSYVIVIGGCILGLTAALGLAGFMLSQPAADGGVKPAITNGSQATAITETDQPTSQEPSIPDPSDDTANRLSNDESTTVTAPDIEKRPTSEPKTSSEDTPIEQPSPALVVEQEQQESESSPTTLPNEPQDNQQIDLADDDLASFARWLQSPDSTEQFPPPVPTQPKPKPNVAEQKTVLVKPLQPTRPIPNKVDVASRLEDPIIAVEFKSVSLANALRTISNYSTIPITIDPNGLGRRNLTANKPVDLLIRNESTVGQVLTKLLGELHLGYFVVDGQLIVTTAKSSQGKLTQLNHRVGDLCDNNPESMAAFSQWLQKFVEYGSWASQGGEGKCQVDGTTLVIEHDDTVQYQILLLCERLRLARGSIAQSRIRPEFVELTPKRDLLRASQRPITLRVWRDANLDAIAASIEDQADIKLLVDWYALHLAGWSPRDQMKFFCQDLPLKEALAKLLQPMGLTYRILDNATLQITSLEAISTDMDVEFYPLPAGESYEELSEKIVRKIGPAQFQPTGRGSINFDVKSNSLIVSLPQPDQAIVQATIAP